MNCDLWRLVDYYDRDDESGEYRETVIHSASQLREMLMGFCSEPPRIIEIYSPHRVNLRIGIGGIFAGLALYTVDGTGPQKQYNIRVLLAKEIVATSYVDFDTEGSPNRLNPESLHISKDIIDLICHFYDNEAMPSNLTWKSI